MAITVVKNRVVLTSHAFTGSTQILAADANKRYVVTGWSLTVSGADATVSPRFGASSDYLSSHRGVASVGLPWVVSGVRFVSDKNQAIVLVGGAASAVIDGHVTVEIETPSP